MDSAWVIISIVAAIVGACLLIYAGMCALSQATVVDDIYAVPVALDTVKPEEQTFVDFWRAGPTRLTRIEEPLIEMSNYEPATIDDSTVGVFDWLKVNYSPKPVDTAGIQPAPRKNSQ